MKDGTIKDGLGADSQQKIFPNQIQSCKATLISNLTVSILMTFQYTYSDFETIIISFTIYTNLLDYSTQINDVYTKIFTSEDSNDPQKLTSNICKANDWVLKTEISDKISEIEKLSQEKKINLNEDGHWGAAMSTLRASDGAVSNNKNKESVDLVWHLFNTFRYYNKFLE